MRCNNYAMLQSIPCSPECKIVGQILLDHPLSYALTATTDVLAVYLQQFWRTVSKVPSPEETIKFMLNTQQFVYTVDMFRDILYLPVKTLENPFVTPVNIDTIETFMNRVGYQGVMDKKEAIQYPRFIKLIIVDLLKKFPKIPKRIKEDYHSIKDDISLVSVYITRDVRVRGMLIPNAFLTKEICATDNFKEYEMVIMHVDILMNQPQPVVSTQGTHSYKDNPENFNDDDDRYIEKVDEEEGGKMGSLETRTEETQTSIPTPPRSPKTSLSSDKNITQELTKTGVSQLAEKATEELIENNLKPSIATTIIEDRDAFRSEVPYLVYQEFNAQAPQIIKELFKNCVQINIIYNHPSTTTSTETTSSADLKQQLYFKMKRSLQDQADDPALWEVLKCKFEKSFTSNTSCRDDDIHSRHDDHQEDDAPREGEKRVKRHKASKSSKFARVEETVIDEDEVIMEDETPELITKFQDVDKRVPTIYDYKRIKATLNDALSNQFKNAKEIIEVVRITTDQPHGLDFMEQIIVIREKDKPNSFYEADFKYLNKNDIEDLYYLCQNKKVNYPETKLMNSLITLIRSRVIWERVHDFQLLKPSTCLIYLNIKDEKRVMYLTEIVKFCNAMLEKVLNEVKLKIFQSKPWRKSPLFGELDRDILRAFEREITMRLRHREQMRRWESFMNERPILPTMKHL
ncbi:hypothetical protein Tco_1182608 [Tanacetum coccineum]